MLLILGLGHKARQGKNYVANYMKEVDNSIKLYAFADELKLYCKEHHDTLLLEWEKAHPNVPINFPKDDPIYGYTQILQWHGSDVARKQDPDIWVKALDKKIQADLPKIAVITDVRFPNEAEYIKQNGGYLIEVRRLNADGSQFLDTGRDPNHPSETSLDNYEGYDFTIEVKDGDLANLRKLSTGVLNVIKAIQDGDVWDPDDPINPNDQADGFYEPIID